MEIIITQWALNSYLDLTTQRVFGKNEYQHQIRPDVLLLKKYPNYIKFKQPKFWSIAQSANGQLIADGFKMKWHQMGQGKVQLRLPIGLLNKAFLCQAYVKQHSKYELRQLAKFKTHLQLIRQKQYIDCGRL